MKVTFPYMGSTAGYTKIATLLGHDVLKPEKPTQRTMSLGVKYSPEFACFPLKVLLGTYIEAIEQGADTIVSSGGHGPCRAGFYGEVQEKILHSMGYDVDVIIIDSIAKDFKGTMEKVKLIKNNKSWLEVWSAVRTTYKAIKILDDLERQIHVKRAYEVKPGSCTRAWDQIEKIVDKANTRKALNQAFKEGQNILDNIETKEVAEKDKIRIGIIGEIYVVMENTVNMKIEERLGELGCEVQRSQMLSDWVDFHLIPHRFSKPHEAIIREKGTKYFGVGIGGHARENMGWIEEFHEKGFDGIVHLLPFACLPELMSQSIIPTLSQEMDMPILSLSLDEQTGRSNTITRLEAFVDLIKAKKYGSIRQEGLA